MQLTSSERASTLRMDGVSSEAGWNLRTTAGEREAHSDMPREHTASICVLCNDVGSMNFHQMENAINSPTNVVVAHCYTVDRGELVS